MPSPFRSARPTRLARVRASGRVNAVDYLVIPDEVRSFRDRAVLVRLIRDVEPGDLGPDVVTVVGGGQVRDLRTLWVIRLDDVTLLPAVVPPPAQRTEPVDPRWPPFGMSAVEMQELVNGLHANHRRDDGQVPHDWVLVVLDRVADRSTYRLVLGANGEPPARFDPLLSEIAFSFVTSATVDDDVRPVDTDGAAESELPELDYLTRDFAGFRRLLFDRLALLSPDDASDDPAELRTALVEAVAYVADELAYFQDAVATEAYLATARARASVRRHARLLDYPMHEGCAARVFVHVEVAHPVEGTALRAGATFLTRLPTRGVVLGATGTGTASGTVGTPETAAAERPETYEAVVGPHAFRPQHHAIAFHTWGDEDCFLPAGATGATVVDDGLELVPGDYLVLERTRDQPGDPGDPEAHHVVRLVEVSPAPADPLAPGVAIAALRWDERDALVRPWRVSVGDAPAGVVRANLVLAEHGRTVRDEPLTLTRWGRGVDAVLAHAALCWSTPLPAAAAAADVLAPDPARARPVITLAGEDATWVAAETDLLAVSPDHPAFVVEPGGGGARLRFGDGVFGRRPVDLDDFTATYRVGDPTAGNVGAGAIAHLVRGTVDDALAEAVRAVRNPLPAVGGSAPEGVDEVRAYAPRAHRVPRIAVTPAEWSEMAERHPRVQRATAVVEWTGREHTVRLAADPVATTTAEALRDELEDWLAPALVAGSALEVLPPARAAVDIRLGVVVAPDRPRDLVHEQLRREFSTGVLADGRRGFFHPDAFSFGDRVWLSQVIDRAVGVPGVVLARFGSAADGATDPFARTTWFRRTDGTTGTEIDDGWIEVGELEIVRCDDDVAHPEHGRIGFVLVGGR